MKRINDPTIALYARFRAATAAWLTANRAIEAAEQAVRQSPDYAAANWIELVVVGNSHIGRSEITERAKAQGLDPRPFHAEYRMREEARALARKKLGLDELDRAQARAQRAEIAATYAVIKSRPTTLAGLLCKLALIAEEVHTYHTVNDPIWPSVLADLRRLARTGTAPCNLSAAAEAIAAIRHEVRENVQ